MSIIDNFVVRAKTANEAFETWYKMLSQMEMSKGSRDGDVVGEVLNAVTVFDDPTKCVITSDMRKMSMRYAVGELLWYMSGKNQLSEIQKYTSAWDRMSEDGCTVNSNYGYCIRQKFGFDQWEQVKSQLTVNSESRQAVIHIKEARDLMNNPSKDVNCTVCLQFFIRDEKLYLTVYMRSNDIWMGFPYDVFNFSAMQVLMSMEIGVGLGTYTHISGSLHLYKRDLRSLGNV